jgi:hypothetical protein
MRGDTGRSVDEAIDGLRQVLEALGEHNHSALTQMAQALGINPDWLNGTIADMRWMLDALERIQQREAA